MSLTKYDDATLKKIQDIELMILKDFIKICEDNDLDYYMYGGSLLGTIRHNGFIPWDDDVDVIMFRDDFEKFKQIVMSSNNEKYEILSYETEDDYFYLFFKFMLKGTKFEESWISQVNFHIGLNMDVFVIDSLNKNKFKRFYQIKKNYFYNKLIIMSQVKLPNLPFMSKITSHFIYYILKIFGIKPSMVIRRNLNFLKKYGDDDSDVLFDVTAQAYPQIFNRDDFKPIKKVKFEDIYVNVPKNYDKILRNIFGDHYMELPPEDKRYNHPIDIIDFGKY